MTLTRFLPLAALLLLASACGTTRTGKDVDLLLDHSMDLFRARIDNDDPLEAFRIYKAIQAVDPDYPELEEIAEAYRQDHPELVDYYTRELMGVNFAFRQPTDSGIGTRILWYLPDRILDLFDVFSFDIHLGFGVYADVHATRAVQLALGSRAVSGIGWHEQRSLGILTQADANASMFLVGYRGYSATQVGTSGVQSGSWTVAGGHWTNLDLYREFVDWYAIGGSVTAAVAGASADVHPLEIFDFLVGWAFFDPNNDDLGHTRGSKLSEQERIYARLLGKIKRNDDEMGAYRTYRMGLEEAEAEAEAEAEVEVEPILQEEPVAVDEPAPEEEEPAAEEEDPAAEGENQDG